MKRDKKIYIFIAIFLFVSSQILSKGVNNLDEIWNYNFARCTSIGLIPYKQYSIIQGPLLPFICSIFLKIFGNEMIITRFLAIILDSSILVLSYIIMKKLEIKDYLKYIILIIMAIIMKDYFAIDYNWSSLFLVLIIIYLELIQKESYKKNIIIGIIAGTTIALKQTTGIIIVFATLAYNLLTIKNKNDFKEISKRILYRFLGASFSIVIFLVVLLKLDIINQYIDYCIMGINTFTNKINYIDRLIKNSNLIIRTLSILPIIIYLFLGYKYFKTSEKRALILMTYSIAQFIVVYPIADEAHFVLAITPTLISIGYILNMLHEKIRIDKKEEIFIETFLSMMIILISITYFIVSIIEYKNKNINMELNHFKYLPMSEDEISDVKEIDNFIIAQKKDVYILDATAALYMIPIDRYNKDYDMFNKGNFGAKGEDGQIEKLKQTKEKIVLIKSSKYSRNWQNPEKVRNFVINNMNKIGEIGVFDIYE